MMNKDDLLTKQDVCKRFNIGRHTYEEWVAKHELPEIRVSSHKRYIRRADLMNCEERRVDILFTKF